MTVVTLIPNSRSRIFLGEGGGAVYDKEQRFSIKNLRWITELKFLRSSEFIFLNKYIFAHMPFLPCFPKCSL